MRENDVSNSNYISICMTPEKSGMYIISKKYMYIIYVKNCDGKQKKTNTYPRRPIRFVSSPKSNVMHGSPFPSEHTMSPLLLRWMVSELSEPMKGTDNPAIYTFQKRRPTTYPILIFPKRQSSPRDSTIHTILHQRRLTV